MQTMFVVTMAETLELLCSFAFVYHKYFSAAIGNNVVERLMLFLLQPIFRREMERLMVFFIHDTIKLTN